MGFAVLVQFIRSFREFFSPPFDRLVDRIQRLVRTPDGGDDFVWIGNPLEGLRVGVVIVEEAVDGGLEVGDGSKHAAFEAALGQDGEKAFDGVEPRGRGRREVERPSWVARQPSSHGWMLMGGVVVDDRVDRLPGGNLALDGVEKADELLMPMALHVAADHGSVEHVHRRKQGRRPVPLVVMGHGSGAALLERQPGLGPVERLDLALFVDAEHDSVRRRIDVEPDDVAQLADEVRVIGQLELPDAMRLEPVRAPDALHGTDADTHRLGHRPACPMRPFARRLLHGQRDDALRDGGIELRDAGGPRLVAQKPGHAFGGEALLPAPDAGLGLARLAHDRVCPQPLGAEQHDLRTPHMLLRRVAVIDHCTKLIQVGRGDGKGNASSHAPNSHATSPTGIRPGIQMLGSIH